ncbi:MAG TPA: NPCBM/NEW2 domain-containing protein [Armatimonadota bacterium]|nr:NPCBM/NEW2 domain-containing protein [Armatimonadota bacterium]
MVASLCALLCLGSASAPAGPTQFHVSPTGDDTNPGTRSRPFATLERARDAIRALKSEQGLPEGGITVVLHPGVHRRTAGFVLEEQDSGEPGKPVVYRSLDAGAARLVGGLLIPPRAFAPVTDAAIITRLDASARAAVRQADLHALGVHELGAEWPDRFRGYVGWPELFVDGVPMTLARWPNEGLARVARVIDSGSKPRWAESPDRPGVFEYEGDRPTRWLKADRVYLNGYWAYKWYNECIRVDRIDPDARTITFAAPHLYGVGGPSGGEYYALNLLEELDRPGEYFIDAQSGRLYLWPPEPLVRQEIGLSLLNEPLIQIRGASHITLRGLTLELSRDLAVTIEGGSDNRVAGCTMRNLATDAVRVSGGERNGVVACDIYDMGGGGVILNGGDRATLTPCGNHAANNHIHHYGRLFRTHRDAVTLNGVGCRASHNLIHDAPHHAIDFGGNDHVIEFNEIHHVCLETDDAGAIYTGRDWTVRGTIIRHNYFHDIGGGPSVGNQTIYLDDTACGTTCVGNVIRNVYRAILVGGGRDNVVENNLIADCRVPIHVDNRGMSGEWLEGQEVYTKLRNDLKQVPYQSEIWAARFPELARILDDDPGLPKGNVIRHNVSIACGAPNIAEEARQHGTITDNWELQHDPGLLDASEPAARADLPGFEPPPLGSMGLVPDEYRRRVAASMPWAQPGGGTFVGEALVYLRCSTGDAVIRYTTDGSEPGRASRRYSGPIRLTETTTLKAAAFPRSNLGGTRSPTLTAIYRKLVLAPGQPVYLSDITPQETQLHGLLRFDVGYTGQPIAIAGRRFARGLSTHPVSAALGGTATVTYVLAPALSHAQALCAWVGVDDSAEGAGSVTFAVEVLRQGEWVRVYESGVRRGGEAPVEVRADIRGAERLRLIASDASDDHYSDHAVWADVRLE